MKKLSLALVALIAFSSAPAFAFKLGARGAYGIGGGSAHTGYAKGLFPILGGELTYGLGPVDFGFFYDLLPLNPGGDKSTFMGAVGRFSIPGAGFFADAKLGLSKTSFSAGGSSDNALSYGVGLGKDYGMGPLSIGPRVGYNLLKVKSGTSSATRSVIDLGVLVSFGF